MEKETGGPAFPITATQELTLEKGMTLRDYFAAKAMQSLMIPDDNYREFGNTENCVNDKVAAISYMVADAMLKERGK